MTTPDFDAEATYTLRISQPATGPLLECIEQGQSEPVKTVRSGTTAALKALVDKAYPAAVWADNQCSVVTSRRGLENMVFTPPQRGQ